MNSRSALGDELPKKRILINTLMIFSAGIATFASIWALNSKGIPGMIGMGVLVLLAVVGITGYVRRNKLAH